LEKRFERDFEVLEIIGEGGFATVYKARNLLDDIEYALKKIVISTKNKKPAQIKAELQGVLNEIRCLAKIKNDFVTKYNHSWVEVELKENVINNDHEVEAVEELKYQKDNECSFELSYSSFCDIEFQSRHEDEERILSRINFVNNISNNEMLSTATKTDELSSDSSEEIFVNQVSYDIKEIKKLNIYIQMELCKETLQDYINSQKESRINKDGLYSREKLIDNLKIFSSVTRALDFIHYQENIIHRDLKPQNIFLTEDRNVKIGDFGLATDIYNQRGADLTRKNSCVSSNSNNILDSTTLSYHTKNVGTLLYASPEQLNENYYDQKSDIFSLGLILFELVVPFKTLMEKHERFRDLKNNKIPENLNNLYKNLAHLITSMTDKSPSRRPETKYILNTIQDEIKELENVGNNNQSNLIKKRKRFLSEELSQIKSYEFFMIFEDSEDHPQRIFIKIIADKMLILPSKISSKAIYIYDLFECEISHCIKDTQIEIVVDHPYLNKCILSNEWNCNSKEFYESISCFN